MTLGPHTINVTPAAMAWAKRAGIVKAVDNLAPLQAASDSAIRVFRLSVPNEMDCTDPQGTVNRIVAALKGYRHPRLYLQLWCGAHPSYQQLSAAVTWCHMSNYMTVGSSWFTGDYTQADWNDAYSAGVDAFGPQCYWGNQGFTPDHAVRYRQFWRAGQPPVMILECGRDKVEGGKGGYVLDGLTPTQYAVEVNAYGAEIAKDSYNLGGTPFTSGPTPGNPPTGWDPYNMDPVSPFITGGTVPTTFNVGAGILALMTQKGDTPQSDEHYVVDTTGQTFQSVAFGKLGKYEWNKQANVTVFFPFG